MECICINFACMPLHCRYTLYIDIWNCCRYVAVETKPIVSWCKVRPVKVLCRESNNCMWLIYPVPLVGSVRVCTVPYDIVCRWVFGRHTLESFISLCRSSSPFQLLLPEHVSNCKAFNLRRLRLR